MIRHLLEIGLGVVLGNLLWRLLPRRPWRGPRVNNRRRHNLARGLSISPCFKRWV